MSLPTLTTYGGALRSLGYAGEVVDLNTVESETLMNDQATAIQYGAAVARSAADNTCKAPAADADKIVGLSMRFPIKAVQGASVGGTNTVQYNQYDAVPVMRTGFMYVQAAENVTRGDAALSLTAGNGTVGGTTGGGAGAGRVAIPNATWETTTTAGNIGIVRINN